MFSKSNHIDKNNNYILKLLKFKHEVLKILKRIFSDIQYLFHQIFNI